LCSVKSTEYLAVYVEKCGAARQAIVENEKLCKRDVFFAYPVPKARRVTPIPNI